MQVKKKQQFVERERDNEQIRKMHSYQAAAAQNRANEDTMRRQSAMAAAEENRRLAENKRRNAMAERVRVDLKEEIDITRNKYKIQSSLIR